MLHPTPQIPACGSHRCTEASSSTPPDGHCLKSGASPESHWASALAAGCDLADFAIFGLKRPRVRADTEATGELRRRTVAGTILPQVRSVAAGSPAATTPKVTSVSVERWLVRGWLCPVPARRHRSRLAHTGLSIGRVSPHQRCPGGYAVCP
jgi:hypothetical protein